METIKKKTKVTPKEITRLQGVSHVRLSPNGKRVAYVVSSTCTKSRIQERGIWLSDVEDGKPFLLSKQNIQAQEPSWSPDSECIAFLSKKEGCKLYIVNNEGETVSTHDIPNGSHSISWSPDGSLISFLCHEVKEKSEILVAGENHSSTHLYVVNPKTGDIKQVTKGKVRIAKYEWAPDSKQFVAAITNTSSQNQDIVIFHLHNLNQQFLMQAHDMTIMLSWSPDGKFIAWCGREHEPESGQMMIIPLGTSSPRTICADFPGSVKWMNFLPSGRVIFAALQHFRVGLFSTTVEGDVIDVLLDSNDTKPGSLGSGSFAGYSVSLSADGSRFATTISGPKEPGNVAVGEWGKSLVRVTDLNSEVNDMAIGETEEVSWFAKDGLEIHGLLIKPVDYIQGKRYPTIVEIHGGPRRSWWDTCYVTNSWAQLLANEGYMVLLPNPRGSSGRGADFVRANERDLGGKDFSDIMAGVDYLISEGYTDEDRLGVAGWSYGGYLTSWTITQTNRFKAAVMGASIVNWISWNGQSTMAGNWAKLHWREPLVAYQNPDTLLQRSPIHFVQHVKTPTLIFHGTNDQKIPSVQSDEFHMALLSLGVPVEYVKYQGEGHGIYDENNQLDHMNRIINWFKHYI